MIQVWFDAVDPLVGRARLQPDRSDASGPSTTFLGWLGLLRTLSDLIDIGEARRRLDVRITDEEERPVAPMTGQEEGQAT